MFFLKQFHYALEIGKIANEDFWSPPRPSPPPIGSILQKIGKNRKKYFKPFYRGFWQKFSFLVAKSSKK